MEIFAFAKVIVEVVMTAKDLDAFLNDKIVGVLESIGDAHIEAAAQSLRDARESDRPEREVGFAISSLLQAYQIYTQIADKYMRKQITPDGKLAHTRTKTFQCVASVAICYHYLQVQRLQDKYIRIAMGEFDYYLWNASFATWNRVKYLDYIIGNRYKTSERELIDTARLFRDFCASLGYSYKVGSGKVLWKTVHNLIFTSIKEAIGAEPPISDM